MFIHLSVNATRSNRGTWGDTQYAEGLARAIRRIPGCGADLLFRGELPDGPADPSVLLRICGPHLEEPVPGLTNLLWLISPPTIASARQLGGYQAVFCASQGMTDQLRRIRIAATYLPQATEPAHFNPRQRPLGAADVPVVFVGGYAPRAPRRIVLDAVAAGFEPQIWGPGWKGVVPDRLWHGERLDYDGLAGLYASARVVLNSHMDDMARLGFMSNRSYDALASGALVLSDAVAGFSDADLPELRQLQLKETLAEVLGTLLAAPLDGAGRRNLHDRIAARHSFDARAKVLVERARQLVEEKRKAQRLFLPGRSGGVPPRLTDPAVSAPTVRAAMQGAAMQMLAICRYLEEPGAQPLPGPRPAEKEGVIHPMMANLRRLQRIACAADPLRQTAEIETLAAAAVRVAETLGGPELPAPFRSASGREDALLVRIMRNEPLWFHAPEGFDRERGKVNLRLWPKRQPPKLSAGPGVFLHLYHDDLAPAFAERLGHIGTAFRLYVSTDSQAKAARIRAALPAAEVRVLENRGRDIWPKLYGFADAHDRHEVVLHMHGKKSPHSGRLDDWLVSILECLLGSPAEVNRILSFFETIPRLGLVVPAVFRGVLDAAHWGANRDIAEELATRMGMTAPLPDDAALRFPVGSMFWARTAAIRPLLDLRLRPEHFPPEAGQVDGTLAHAIERMLGVTCRATGHHILQVSGAGSRLHARHQQRFASNGELRDALDSGLFDG